MITLPQNNAARDRFYNSQTSQFGIGDIPPEVFGRLNVHAQQSLKDGRTVPINPSYFANSQGSTQGTSLLGAGTVAPGPLEQPAPVQQTFSNNPSPNALTTPVKQDGGQELYPNAFGLDFPVGQENPATLTTAPVLNSNNGAKLKPSQLAFDGFSGSLFDNIRQNQGAFELDEAFKDLYSQYYTADGEKRAIYGEDGELIDIAFDASFDPNGIDQGQAGRDDALNFALTQAGVYGLKEAFLTSKEGIKFLTETGIGSALNTSFAHMLDPTALITDSSVDWLASSSALESATPATLAGGITAGLTGKTLADIVVGGNNTGSTSGAALSGALAFALGGGPLGIGAAAFLGGTIGGFAAKGKKLHAGEYNIGNTFKRLQDQSLFGKDQDKAFAKNLALARLSNPNEGDDSTGDALHEVADRVNVNVKEQTILGFKELIQEGHVSKQEILANLSNDLELFRGDIEKINGPAPKPQQQTQVSSPDSTFEEAGPETPEPFNFEPEQVKKKKEKPKTKPTTQTSPSGLKGEPVILAPSLMG